MENKQKRIYISLPICGYEDTVFERSEAAKQVAEKMGFIPMSPIDENEIDESNIENHEDLTAEYMGNDICTLLKCDAILMCHDWNHSRSRGCRVELFTAITYGLKVYFEDDFI